MENKELHNKFEKLTRHHLNNEFVKACIDSDLEVIEYLLISRDLKNHASIHFNEDLGFINACEYGNLEVVKYLLTSPKIKKHSNLNADNDAGFRYAYWNNCLDIVKYLIFEMNIEKSKSIKDWIKEYPDSKEEVEKWFKKRKSHKQLEKELAFETSSKTNKVKI